MARMRSVLVACVVLAACTPPRVGVVPRFPDDRLLSVGVTDNGGGAPKSAAVVNLKFKDATASESTIAAIRFEQAPTVDGDAAEWAAASPSTVALVAPWDAIGMSRAQWDAEWQLAFGRVDGPADAVEQVNVRAGFDDEYVYFLLDWADAVENSRRGEWRHDGTSFKPSAEDEDRAYLSFAIAAPPGFEALGCAAACHVRERPGEVTPEAKAFRFQMHTSAPGELVDIWHWKAARTNPQGFADDQHWDHERRKADGPLDFAFVNRTAADAGVDQPLFMAEGGLGVNPRAVFAGDAGSVRAVPFDGTGAIAGMTIPGWVQQRASPERADVRAVGVWAGGRWTVEFARKLETADPKDAQFPLTERK